MPENEDGYEPLSAPDEGRNRLQKSVPKNIKVSIDRPPSDGSLVFSVGRQSSNSVSIVMSVQSLEESKNHRQQEVNVGLQFKFTPKRDRSSIKVLVIESSDSSSSSVEPPENDQEEEKKQPVMEQQQEQAVPEAVPAV